MRSELGQMVYGGELGVSFQSMHLNTPVVLPVSCRVSKGRVSGTGNERRWYIDKVTRGGASEHSPNPVSEA